MNSKAALPEKEVLNRQLSCLLVREQEQLSVSVGSDTDNVYLPCHLSFAISSDCKRNNDIIGIWKLGKCYTAVISKNTSFLDKTFFHTREEWILASLLYSHIFKKHLEIKKMLRTKNENEAPEFIARTIKYFYL